MGVLEEKYGLDAVSDTILPFGDILKPLISTSSVLTNGDLKKTLASKGIFLSSYKKEELFPLLLATLLSPAEYESLRDCQREKEVIPKRRSITFPTTNDNEIIKVIPELRKIKLDELKNFEYENYEIVDVTEFYRTENDNQIKLEYKIKRTDLSKDWYDQVNFYQGTVEVTKDYAENKVIISTEHSTDETKEINNIIVKKVSSLLKETKVTDNEEGQGITFGSFSNESRIKFLLSFIDDSLDKSKTFTFDEMTDIEIAIDTGVKLLPEDLQWMRDKVSNLKVQGKTLHETDLLKESSNHPSLIISYLKIKYDFILPSGKGDCTVEVEFPKNRGCSLPKDDSEFHFKISHINHTSKVNTKSAQSKLYEIFDAFKEKCFENLDGDIERNHTNKN